MSNQKIPAKSSFWTIPPRTIFLAVGLLIAVVIFIYATVTYFYGSFAVFNKLDSGVGQISRQYKHIRLPDGLHTDSIVAIGDIDTQSEVDYSYTTNRNSSDVRKQLDDGLQTAGYHLLQNQTVQEAKDATAYQYRAINAQANINLDIRVGTMTGAPTVITVKATKLHE